MMQGMPSMRERLDAYVTGGITLPVITGPTSQQGFDPPSKTVLKGFPSIVVGFDIVLEHRPGHRY